jgi:exosortase
MISGWLEWPRCAWLFGAALAILYGPAWLKTAKMWFHEETYSHGVFIFPVSIALLYLQRRQIQQAAPRPSMWGLLPLSAALTVQVFSHLLQIYSLEIWSLLLALYGVALLVHGRALWRIVWFPVLFLIFSFPVPGPLLAPVRQWIQEVSTTGAVQVMRGAGYTILQIGNQIEIPGFSLEVAEVCSGYKKLIALLAFSMLYGYLFDIRPAQRALLVLAAVPIAVLANVLRVAGLIAVTSAGGARALEIAHNWGELVALLIAFSLFVLVGKGVGCRRIRFLSPSAS